jgi:hypothetical protein
MPPLPFHCAHCLHCFTLFALCHLLVCCSSPSSPSAANKVRQALQNYPLPPGSPEKLDPLHRSFLRCACPRPVSASLAPKQAQANSGYNTQPPPAALPAPGAGSANQAWSASQPPFPPTAVPMLCYQCPQQPEPQSAAPAGPPPNPTRQGSKQQGGGAPTRCCLACPPASAAGLSLFVSGLGPLTPLSNWQP